MPSRLCLPHSCKIALRLAAAVATIAATARAAAPAPLFVRVLATGSMRPLVSHDMVLPLDHVPYAELTIGCVAVYRHDRTGLVVAHRIVARQFGWFVMKGDSNRTDDTGFMTPKNYLGVVHLPSARPAPGFAAREAGGAPAGHSS